MRTALLAVALCAAVLQGGTIDRTIHNGCELPAGVISVLVYGDSNSDNGHWWNDGVPSVQKWPEYLAKLSMMYRIVNKSSSGETVRWIMDESNPFGSMATRIEDVIAEHGPFQLVLVQLGTNDARFAASEEPPSDQTYHPDSTSRDMQELIERIHACPGAADAVVVLMAPPPVYDCQGWPDTECYPNSNESAGYTVALKATLFELGQRLEQLVTVPPTRSLALFDLFHVFTENETEPPFPDTTQHYMFEDGIHFDDDGQRLVAQEVHAFLQGFAKSAAILPSAARTTPTPAMPRCRYLLDGRSAGANASARNPQVTGQRLSVGLQR